MRSIGVVTVARSDYGIYRPILRRIQSDPDLKLVLFVSGAHLSPEFGLTVREIEQDGFPVAERVEMLLSSDSPAGTSKAIGLGIIGFAQAFTRTWPDLLLVLGDRFEMFAAAAAALPFNLPVAHIHGGEATFGAMDESLRHAITKLSHLHFAATQVYGDRIIHMGEAPWRVTVSGAPALDTLNDLPAPDTAAFEHTYQVCVTPPPLLVTYHPVTLELAQAADQIDALLGALDDAQRPIIFTDPNADAGSHVIRERIIRYVATHAQAWRVPNFGATAYYDALRLCTAMVGNSSSGLIEAPSFQLPVVNIGTRQDGRVRAANVIDVGYERSAIAQAIRHATAAEFRASLQGLVNPYGDGHAADRIVNKVKSIEIDDYLIRKIFYDTARQPA
jgi:UDP-hydrolysing UDP-N-acetyl-D-glucosamine 2-epimerase